MPNKIRTAKTMPMMAPIDNDITEETAPIVYSLTENNFKQ
jgi:hypothetical protein